MKSNINQEVSVFNIKPEDAENFRLGGVDGYLMAVIERTKMHMGTLTASSEARGRIHTVFISFNSVFLGGTFSAPIVSLISNPDSFEQVMGFMLKLTIAIGIAGCIASSIWLRAVAFYRTRSREGVCLVSEVDAELPLQYFDAEYSRMKKNGSFRGVLYHLPSYDLLLPWYFIVVYGAMPFVFRWVFN